MCIPRNKNIDSGFSHIGLPLVSNDGEYATIDVD